MFNEWTFSCLRVESIVRRANWFARLPGIFAFLFAVFRLLFASMKI